MAFLPGGQKSGRNNDRGDRITEVVLRRGFTAQQTQHGVASGIRSQAKSCKEVSALTLSRSHALTTVSPCPWLEFANAGFHFRSCEISQLLHGQNQLHLHFIIR